jgi:hypothetical protein
MMKYCLDTTPEEGDYCEEPNMEAIAIYRALFMGTLKQHTTPEELLENIAPYGQNLKGISPVSRDGRVVGFTMKRSTDVNPRIRTQMNEIKARWLELTETVSEEHIAPHQRTPQELFHWFVFTRPDEMKPCDIAVMKERVQEAGMIERDNYGLRATRDEYRGIEGYLKIAVCYIDKKANMHRDAFRNAKSLDEVDALVPGAIEDGFLEQDGTGLIVQASHSGQFGWNVWEHYLKAIRRYSS